MEKDFERNLYIIFSLFLFFLEREAIIDVALFIIAIILDGKF